MRSDNEPNKAHSSSELSSQKTTAKFKSICYYKPMWEAVLDIFSKKALKNAWNGFLSRVKNPYYCLLALSPALLCFLPSTLHQLDLTSKYFLFSNIKMCIIIILSPLSWELREDDTKLNNISTALLLQLTLVTTITIIFFCLKTLPIPFGDAKTFHQILQSITAAFCFCLPVGWLQAYMTLSQERSKIEQKKLNTMRWMLYTPTFDSQFLIRHLKNIETTAKTAPLDGADQVLILTALYRQWLNMSESPLVSLEEERHLVEVLEDVESAQGFHIEWDWQPGTMSWKLPPFVIFEIIQFFLSERIRHAYVAAQGNSKGLTVTLSGEYFILNKKHKIILDKLKEKINFSHPDGDLSFSKKGAIIIHLPGILT